MPQNVGSVDYNMLQLLNLPPLSVRREYLKLTAMYNIVNGYSYYPSGMFVQSNSPYTTLVIQLMLILLDLMHVPITCTIRLFLM